MSKTAILPQVRVEPDFRAQAEAALRPGESLSELVESAVRRTVERRRVDAEFHARGQAAWVSYQAKGESYSAAEVLATLRARTDARRAELDSKTAKRQA